MPSSSSRGGVWPRGKGVGELGLLRRGLLLWMIKALRPCIFVSVSRMWSQALYRSSSPSSSSRSRMSCISDDVFPGDGVFGGASELLDSSPSTSRWSCAQPCACAELFWPPRFLRVTLRGGVLSMAGDQGVTGENLHEVATSRILD